MWELIARERIRDLVAAYAHCADGGRFDELVALFSPDGVLETPDGRRHAGRDAIRAFLDATRTQLVAAAAPRIRHHVSTLQIAIEGPTAARGAAYFLVVGAAGLDHWGRYRDRYVAHRGVWQYAHRRVRLDGSAGDSGLARRAGAPR
jgi:uncharacterized protein (TIGR02246 family)